MPRRCENSSVRYEGQRLRSAVPGRLLWSAAEIAALSAEEGGFSEVRSSDRRVARMLFREVSRARQPSVRRWRHQRPGTPTEARP